MNRASLPFRAFRFCTRAAAVLVPAAVLTLIAYLLWRGLPAMETRLLFGDADPVQAMLGSVPVSTKVSPESVSPTGAATASVSRPCSISLRHSPAF